MKPFADTKADPSDLDVGVFVRWQSSGGTAQGRIERIITEGQLAVPDSEFVLNASDDDPAVLIRIYRPDDDEGWIQTDTFVGHRASTLTVIDDLKSVATKDLPDKYQHIDFSVPQGVRDTARRAVEWIDEGLAGDGFTAVGRARANDLADPDYTPSPDIVRRMASYFARHQRDKEAEGFNRGEEGYPSAGRVAWDAWGGDPGQSYANRIKNEMDAADKEENSMTVATKEVKAVSTGVVATDQDEGVVTAIVSVTGNTDEGSDIIQYGAFKKTITERGGDVKVLDNHNADSTKDNLGKVISIQEVDRAMLEQLAPDIVKRYPDATGGVVAKMQFFDDDADSWKAFKQIQRGQITGYSIGFQVMGTPDFEKRNGKRVRIIKEVKLFEVSPVNFAMNTATGTVHVKAVTAYQDLPLAPRNRDWDSQAAEARVRAWAGGEDDMDWEQYARAFFWHDASAPELFGSYKLGYADVIDGELHAVPRAIFTVAGGRGVDATTDIPDDEIEEIKAQVTRYYAKMRDAFDDDTMISPFIEGSAMTGEDERKMEHEPNDMDMDMDKPVTGLAAIPNLRDGSPKAACASCTFYKKVDGLTGKCVMYDAHVMATMMCDMYEPRRVEVDESMINDLVDLVSAIVGNRQMAQAATKTWFSRIETKAGRTISAANMERLINARASLLAIMDILTTLIEAGGGMDAAGYMRDEDKAIDTTGAGSDAPSTPPAHSDGPDAPPVDEPRGEEAQSIPDHVSAAKTLKAMLEEMDGVIATAPSRKAIEDTERRLRNLNT